MTYPWFRALVAVAALAAPVAAQAHAILIKSDPAIDAAVKAGPIKIELRYNSRIDATRSRLTLRRPDQTQSVLPLEPAAHDDTLAATADLPQGDYVLRWQVLAVDGHITRGDVPFSVAP